MKNGDVVKFGEKDEVLNAVRASTPNIEKLQNKT